MEIRCSISIVPTLDQLLQGVGAGDPAALRSLYDATSRRVYGLALRILRDHHTAQEVTLDVYFRVWRQASRFDGSRGRAESWLLTLAHHQAVDRLRSRQRRATRELPLELHREVPDGKPNPEALSLGAELVRHLRVALLEIPETQRRAIVAAYFGGMSHSEIAAAFGVPLGTIKTRIRSGMIALRRALSDGGGPACPPAPLSCFSVASREARERRSMRIPAAAAGAPATTCPTAAAHPNSCERPSAADLPRPTPSHGGPVAAAPPAHAPAARRRLPPRTRRDRTVTEVAAGVTSVPAAPPYIRTEGRLGTTAARGVRSWASAPRVRRAP